MANKTRLDYLDIAKAITIFLVIMGHTTGGSVTPYYRLVIYSFHMPLFFMVSGSVIHRHRHEYNMQHWLNFFRKNIVAIVIPYFIWTIIYGSLDYTKLPLLFYASLASLNSYGTSSFLWFLPCLFVARILMELILMISTKLKFINRHVFAFVMAIVSFIIAFTLPYLESGYPWCLDCAFNGLGFMLAGYSLKEVIDNKSIKFLSLHLLAYIVIFVGYLIFIGKDLPYISMYNNNINDPISFFILGFSGCGIVLSISRIIDHYWKNSDGKIKKAVLWTGRSTIGIYLLHLPFLREVVVPFLMNLGLDYESLITSFIGSILTFIYCCFVIQIIERYIPQLFGKFPDKRVVAIKED